MKVNSIKRLKSFIFIFNLIFIGTIGLAQDQTKVEKKAPPPLQSNRADEDYTYLKDKKSNPYQQAFGDALKYIALDTGRTTYLTIGGSYRARVEYFTNKNWTTLDQSYYSQRLTLHTGLNLGQYVRFFGELYHGYTSDTLQFLQSDELDWHQGFVEFKVKKEKGEAYFRFGRQELAFGANRLIGTRDGTNIRRSFDLAKLELIKGETSLQLFYGKEVDPGFEVFDNTFSLFDSDATNPEIWGAYFKFPEKKNVLTNDLYYIGFQIPRAGFSDVFGKETRHTIGIRRFGEIGKHFKFNTELIYQFGKLGSSTISAFDIETDWKYLFLKAKWRPILGIKLDFSSGDRELADDKIQTFNPLFVNPAIYSLAAVNTPANLMSFHPSITIFPAKNLSIYIDYAFFYRTSKNDGLYTPPRFQIRSANGLSERHIGDALGLILNYTLNRNISMSFMSTYFIPAEFIEASGSSERTLFIAPTINLLF